MQHILLDKNVKGFTPLESEKMGLNESDFDLEEIDIDRFFQDREYNHSILMDLGLRRRKYSDLPEILQIQKDVAIYANVDELLDSPYKRKRFWENKHFVEGVLINLQEDAKVTNNFYKYKKFIRIMKRFCYEKEVWLMVVRYFNRNKIYSDDLINYFFTGDSTIE